MRGVQDLEIAVDRRWSVVFLKLKHSPRLHTREYASSVCDSDGGMTAKSYAQRQAKCPLSLLDGTLSKAERHSTFASEANSSGPLVPVSLVKVVCVWFVLLLPAEFDRSISHVFYTGEQTKRGVSKSRRIAGKQTSSRRRWCSVLRAPTRSRSGNCPRTTTRS